MVRWVHLYLSMVGFAALFFFSVTGLTLNHPTWLGASEEHMETLEGEINSEWLGYQELADAIDAEEAPDVEAGVDRLEIATTWWCQFDETQPADEPPGSATALRFQAVWSEHEGAAIDELAYLLGDWRLAEGREELRLGELRLRVVRGRLVRGEQGWCVLPVDERGTRSWLCELSW